MSKVSIIVPFYNCPYIDQALDSLIHQTYKNIEIIVVNDGSTQYAEKIIPYFNRIKYIKKENGGTASALNTGIAHASGDYFCWLSSDDVFFPEKTEVQLDFMKRHNSFFSYTGYHCINEQGDIIARDLGTNSSNRLELLRKMRGRNIINGCTVMIDKTVFNRVGIFDQSLPYTHDYDLWMRIIQKYDVYYISQPLLLYRMHEQMGSIKHAAIIKEENRKVIERYRAKLGRLMEKQLRNNN